MIAVALAAAAILGFVAGQPATLGAISASISDLPAPWREKARTMGFGFALALIATTAIQLALPWPPAALLTIGAIAFAGGMITGMGRWAIAVGMQAIIPMVFVLGFPRETFATAMRIEALFAVGGFAYIAFALLATIVTDASARRLVATESIRELSIYLRAVAAIFDPEADLEAAYGAAIRQQAALAEQLQSARALLLDRARRGSESLRLAATIGILLDAFDALVAAQCDVALIRETPAAASLLRHIRAALRVGALDLDHLSLEILTTDRPTLPPDHQLAIDALEREAAKLDEGAADRRAVDALRAATRRLVLALGHIRRLEKALSDEKTAETAIGGVEPRGLHSGAVIFARRACAAFHLGLAGPALLPAARACDDGGSDRRAIPRRRRARQLGPADDLGDHARELRADQAAARRPGRRHIDRLRGWPPARSPGCRRALWSRRRDCRSPSPTASSGSIICSPRPAPR